SSVRVAGGTARSFAQSGLPEKRSASHHTVPAAMASRSVGEIGGSSLRYHFSIGRVTWRCRQERGPLMLYIWPCQGLSSSAVLHLIYQRRVTKPASLRAGGTLGNRHCPPNVHAELIWPRTLGADTVWPSHFKGSVQAAPLFARAANGTSGREHVMKKSSSSKVDRRKFLTGVAVAGAAAVSGGAKGAVLKNPQTTPQD